MSLGLGELPPEIFGVAPVADAKASRKKTPTRAEPQVFDLDVGTVPAVEASASETAGESDQAMDLSELLESLDRSGDATIAPAVSSSDLQESEVARLRPGRGR